MSRREFIALAGAVMAWPFAARAQQPVMPVIGFLKSESAAVFKVRMQPFQQGLQDGLYREPESVDPIAAG
jgi:putative tryptophan/tyrosine transport system substrate-binding protein